MNRPIETLGLNFLTRSIRADQAADGGLSKLSRRGFLLATAALTSCSAAPGRKDQATAGAAPEPVRNAPNPGYRTPSVQGPVPRNPDMSLSSNFRSSDITVSRVLVSGNFCAITFDDGPHPQNTPRLLDMLRARNVRATFYVIGRNVDLYPNVVRRTVAEGHEIGNHSHTHRLLSKLSDSEVRQEMQRCNEAIGRAAGVRPRTMRPPYGGLMQAQRQMVYQEFGFPTVLWSVDPLDWKRPGPGVVTSRILSGTTPGGIVLAHDLHAQTVDAMPATLDGLLRRGFKFVTVSQLIAMRREEATVQASATPTAP